VQSLLVVPNKSDRTDNGNLIGLLASYQTADGRNAQLADVWLRKLPVNENDAMAAGLGNLLAGGGNPGSGSGPAPGASGAQPGGAGATEPPGAPVPGAGAPAGASAKTPVSAAVAQLADQLGGFGRDGKPLPQGLVPQHAVDLLRDVQDEERRRNLLLSSQGGLGKFP